MNILELFPQLSYFAFSAECLVGTEVVYVDGKPSYKVDSRDLFALRRAYMKGYDCYIVAEFEPEIEAALPKQDWLKIITEREFKELIEEKKLIAEQTLVMGFDRLAESLLPTVLLSAAPANAMPDIKMKATYISPHAAGAGCIRDVIEKTMRLNGDF